MSSFNCGAGSGYPCLTSDFGSWFSGFNENHKKAVRTLSKQIVLTFVETNWCSSITSEMKFLPPNLKNFKLMSRLHWIIIYEFKRLSAQERIRRISDLHRLASFFQWEATIIFNVQISHLFGTNRFFSFFTRRFSRWPRNCLICLGWLWNFTINVGHCQNTVFYCSTLIILHAKV